MVKQKKLRWGLLGTARINRALIPTIRSSKSSELVAVASRTQEKGNEYSHTWEIPRVFSSYDAMLADPEIDVIYNSLPNSLHAEWSIKAMQMGKHVLCEKPISTKTSDIDEVIKVASETGMVITEALMYRHHPQTILVKLMIDNGEIGKLQYVNGSFCYTNTRSSDPRFDPNLGGGSLWDVGCYPISYSRFIIGHRPIEIDGHQVIGPTGIDLLFSGQMQYPCGIVAQFNCSFITPFKAEMEFIGNKGRIIIPEPYKPGSRTKIIIERASENKILKVKGAELYQGEVNDMENAILHNKPTRISLEESKDNIVTIESLYKSAKYSKRISN
jgi:D-xylose 1-dehydrogenase (NADP+, D-xylono-1,5-lactone-forming)